MYLRSVVKRAPYGTYRYWRLVETVRTARGPRQRIIAHLGDLSRFTAADWQALADRMGTPEMANILARRVRQGGRRGRPPKWTLGDETGAAQSVPVRLETIRLSDVRDFGEVYVALHLWKRLGLGRLLDELVGAQDTRLPVPLIAALIAVNRLVAPTSELEMVRWWETTALPELLGIARGALDEDRLYRTLDAVGTHKARIEQHLGQTGQALFARDYTVLIYDLTSTYFEGRGEANPKAQRGYSRDHRPDCVQVCIGVVVDRSGFPVGYEVLNGNVHDHQTVLPMVEQLEQRYGPPGPERLVCLDRGMVLDKDQQNLQELRRRGYRYVVADRRHEARRWWARATPAGWQVLRQAKDGQPLVEVQEVGIDGADRLLLVRSAGCRVKERGMHDRFLARLTEALSQLEARVKAGRLRNPIKIERRIGAILARHPGLNRWVEVQCQRDPLRVIWSVKPDVAEGIRELEGIALLRSNHRDCSAGALWEHYVQLVKVENTFRTLKSDLRIRPIFHRKEPRIDAHILFSFLAYALYWTLEHLHRRRGGTLTGRRLLEVLRQIKLGTITGLSNAGWRFRLHRICDPNQAQREILATLGIALPRPTTRLEQVSLTI